MVFHVSFFIITFFILFKRKQMDLNLSELQNLLGSVSALFSSEVKTLFIKRIKIYRVYMHDKTEYQNRKLFVYFDPLMSSHSFRFHSKPRQNYSIAVCNGQQQVLSAYYPYLIPFSTFFIHKSYRWYTNTHNEMY